MLRVMTAGGTVHLLDPENARRMRLPAEGRGQHHGDGEWQRMLSYSGFTDNETVSLAVGVPMLCIGSDFSWFLTSPVTDISEVE